jgi:hypothetical protein
MGGGHTGTTQGEQIPFVPEGYHAPGSTRGAGFQYSPGLTLFEGGPRTVTHSEHVYPGTRAQRAGRVSPVPGVGCGKEIFCW